MPDLGRSLKKMIRFLVLLTVLFLAACGEERADVSDGSNRAASDSMLNEWDPDKLVTVFVHHPLILPDVTERDHDGRLIDSGLDELDAWYTQTGGLGQGGYTTQISRSGLGNWLAFIDSLHEKNALHYYRDYGLDEHGFGIVEFERKRTNAGSEQGADDQAAAAAK